MDVSPVIVDIETAPLENAREFIAAPNLDDIKAPSNYVKAEAISDYVKRETAKRLADFERDCTSKAALDFNTARIIALGWWTELGGTEAYLTADEEAERLALYAFWRVARDRQIVGFYIRQFDLPMMIQRSRYLGVPHLMPDLGRYSRSNGVVDLYDLLTFNDLRAETIMSRSVHSFCRRFGIPVEDIVSGADIPALVAAGDWTAVDSHVRSDIALEVSLARRLGVLQPVAESAAI